MRAASEDFDYHASYHKDGRVHHKDLKGSRYKIHPRQGPPLDEFTGVFSLWGMNLSPATKFFEPCDPTKFDEVFEIPRNHLTGDAVVHSSLLEVYLVEPGKLPPTYPPSTPLLDRHIFKDAIPWIVVSLYDLSWLRHKE